MEKNFLKLPQYYHLQLEKTNLLINFFNKKAIKQTYLNIKQKSFCYLQYILGFVLPTFSFSLNLAVNSFRYVEIVSKKLWL